ncbi:MAG: hypothetical protein HZB76_01025 [Chlamydiae bacterium]|nr:hypothetical protein [Chlamydiota bacterium]
MQSRLEKEELQNQAKVEAQALALYKNNPLEAKNYLTDYCDQNVKKVLKDWWPFLNF